MKHEWKKQEKGLYMPGEGPEILKVPQYKYFTLSGKGNPNGVKFAEEVGVLYSLAYAVRMMPKQGYTPKGYFEYTVYPLEGVWDLTEEGRKCDVLNKDELIYTIMIRQPEFVTEDIANTAYDIIRRKKPHPLLENVAFEAMEDGMSVQMLHIGPYVDEPKTFEAMKEFINKNNYERLSLKHREIYLTDAAKTVPQKLKTVLRYSIRKKL